MKPTAKFTVGEIVHWTGQPYVPFARAQDVVILEVAFNDDQKSWMYSVWSDQQDRHIFAGIPEEYLKPT